MRYAVSRPALACVVCLLAVPSRAPGGPDPARPPTIDDLLHLKTISGTQLSPNGQLVAYGVTEADLEHDAFVTHIWVASASGAPPYQLTRGEKSATSFRWT